MNRPARQHPASQALCTLAGLLRQALAGLAVACALGCFSLASAADRWAQLATPLFEHLGLEHGLPHPVAMALAQDGDGYLWIGTQRGLARWDGYRMRSFLHHQADPHSLPGDFIQVLHVDAQGRLWVGTTNAGLAMWDRVNERFIPSPIGKNGNITAMASDGSGGLWVAHAGGLDYVLADGRIGHHYGRDDPAPYHLPDPQIRALLLDQHGDLWIGTGSGLARRDHRNGALLPVPVSAPGVEHWRDTVLALAQNSQGQIAFGTLKSGIGLVNSGSGAGNGGGNGSASPHARILALPEVPDLQAHMVLAMTEATPGRWWAATYGGGVVELDMVSGRAHRIQHQAAIGASLRNDRTAALLRDRSGLLWVANELSVDFHDPNNAAIGAVFGGHNLLESGVTALMTDAGGRAWIALADQGIDLIAPDGKRIAALRPDPAQPDSALPNRVVLALAEAEPGEAWIGTQLGLYHTNSQGRAVSRIALPGPNPYPRVGTVLVRQGKVWLGTFGGLLCYDPQAASVRTFVQGRASAGGLTDNRIHAVLEDRDSALWVATRNGLNRLDPASGAVEQIQADAASASGLSEPLVSSLAIDRKGRLWVGTTGGGINLLEARDAHGKSRFRRLGLQDGLPSMAVTTLAVSSDGRIWAATADGMAVFDPDTLRARALGRPDGLAFRTFFVGAVAQTPEADLLFGATEGLAVVHPALLGEWRYRPPLVLSAVAIDGRAVIPAQMQEANGRPGLSLTLPPDSKSFEVSLAALDFSASAHNRYAYRLEGYERRWNEADANRRTLTYTNLAPGHYQLHLRGSNRNGVWSGQELSMEVRVLPAWHQTWWAYAAYLLAAGLLALSLYRWRVSSLHRRGAMLEAQVYSRTQHLEKLNAIVKSINEQLDFDALLHTILQETAVIRGIDVAWALVREPGSETLSLRAAWQRDAHSSGAAPEHYRLDLAAAESRYAKAADMIAPDIYAIHSDNGRPCAQLAVRIRIDDQVEGFLIFENFQQQRAFDTGDLDLLKALQEPFVSAFQKARALRLIEQARANAEAATRAKSEFLANISHEIRTPMNAILGFAGLGTHLELAPQPLDYFRKIGRAGQSLLEIINDVLDFSKIESGRLELETVSFDLPDTLNQIADLFAWRAAERGLELVIWADPDVPSTLKGDPLRLSQVLVNLVGNALKFTARGHIQLRVARDPDFPRTDASRVGLYFTVEDSGLGISEEQQARLFQAFAQADASTTRLFGGTGLGLAISQQLVRKMGGLIQLQSQPGKGSTFSFSIVLECPTEQAPRLQPVPPQAQGKRVLVVDDSAPVRSMLFGQLRSLGLEAASAANGNQAMVMAQKQNWDLVLIDCDMPDMDGVQTLASMRALSQQLTLPAIMLLTAYAREHSALAAEQAQMHPFLDKPVNPYQLRAAVLTAFGLDPGTAPARATNAPSSASQRIRGARVLVVDDNAINQQVAAEVLQRVGVIVDLASSGAEAIRMCGLSNYDAVLMDIQMPDMDGYQTTARLRSSGRHNELPIIAMTAHAVSGYRERCLSMGMDDFVTKPIEPEVLYGVLAQWVRSAPLVVDSDTTIAPGDVARRAVLAACPGIDLDAALQRLGGHTALLLRCLGLFVQDFGASLQHIHDAIDSGDYGKAAQLVHKIKGAAANISATDLYRTASALEDRLRVETPDLPQLLDEFTRAFDVVMVSARETLADDEATSPAKTSDTLV